MAIAVAASLRGEIHILAAAERQPIRASKKICLSNQVLEGSPSNYSGIPVGFGSVRTAHPEGLAQIRTDSLKFGPSHQVAVAGLSPAVCPFSLRDDIRKGQSQYSRFGWYCAISTICPIHRTPLFSAVPRTSSMSAYRYRVESRRPDPTVWIATQTSIVYLFGTSEWTKKRVGPWLNLNRCSVAALDERRLPGCRESGSGKRSPPCPGSRFDMGADVTGRRHNRARFALHAYTAVHTSRGVQHTCRGRELATLRISRSRRCLLAIAASLFLPAAACGA
jgi:hypothetical protein